MYFTIENQLKGVRVASTHIGHELDGNLRKLSKCRPLELEMAFIVDVLLKLALELPILAINNHLLISACFKRWICVHSKVRMSRKYEAAFRIICVSVK